MGDAIEGPFYARSRERIPGISAGRLALGAIAAMRERARPLGTGQTAHYSGVGLGKESHGRKATISGRIGGRPDPDGGPRWPHGAPEPSVVALTMLGAGLVTCALLTLISPDGRDAPDGYVVDGFFGDAHPMGPAAPLPDCWCRQIAWRGDHAPIS